MQIDTPSSADQESEEPPTILVDEKLQSLVNHSEFEATPDEDGYVQMEMIVDSVIEPATEVELPEGAELVIKDDSDLFNESLENLELSEKTPEDRNKVVDNFTNPESKPSRMVHKLLWALAGLVMIIGLLSALFWIKRMELAKDTYWRPMVKEICSYIDCGIPPQKDISKIKLQSREVTYGPEVLTINMLLINSAEFEQEYPKIEIKFSDLDGNILATHLVLPAEYLKAGFIGTLMPINIPAHIEFTLDVDTTIAVGFEFKFL